MLEPTFTVNMLATYASNYISRFVYFNPYCATALASCKKSGNYSCAELTQCELLTQGDGSLTPPVAVSTAVPAANLAQSALTLADSGVDYPGEVPEALSILADGTKRAHKRLPNIISVNKFEDTEVVSIAVAAAVARGVAPAPAASPTPSPTLAPVTTPIPLVKGSVLNAMAWTGSPITITLDASASLSAGPAGSLTGTWAASVGTPVCATSAPGGSLTLTCSPTYIVTAVLFAGSGADVTGSCPQYVRGPLTDVTSVWWNAVSSACMGQTSCSVSAGAAAVLTAAVVCTRPDQTASAYAALYGPQKWTSSAVGVDGTPLTLTCPSSQTIAVIQSAFYGTPLANTLWPSAGACDSGGAVGAIKAACVGQASCTFTPSGSFFGGDPCPGTPKSVVVTWTCGGSGVSVAAAATALQPPTLSSSSGLTTTATMYGPGQYQFQVQVGDGSGRAPWYTVYYWVTGFRALAGSPVNFAGQGAVSAFSGVRVDLGLNNPGGLGYADGLPGDAGWGPYNNYLTVSVSEPGGVCSIPMNRAVMMVAGGASTPQKQSNSSLDYQAVNVPFTSATFQLQITATYPPGTLPASLTVVSPPLNVSFSFMQVFPFVQGAAALGTSVIPGIVGGSRAVRWTGVPLTLTLDGTASVYSGAVPTVAWSVGVVNGPAPVLSNAASLVSSVLVSAPGQFVVTLSMGSQSTSATVYVTGFTQLSGSASGSAVTLTLSYMNGLPGDVSVGACVSALTVSAVYSGSSTTVALLTNAQMQSGNGGVSPRVPLITTITDTIPSSSTSATYYVKAVVSYPAGVTPSTTALTAKVTVASNQAGPSSAVYFGNRVLASGAADNTDPSAAIVYSPYTACVLGGYRTRTALCRSGRTGALLSLSHCAGQERVNLTLPCSFQWEITSDWSPCSRQVRAFCVCGGESVVIGMRDVLWKRMWHHLLS